MAIFHCYNLTTFHMNIARGLKDHENDGIDQGPWTNWRSLRASIISEGWSKNMHLKYD